MLKALISKFCRKNNSGWHLVDPSKKGGSFSIYYADKHIANVRGKTKATVLMDAISGVDTTDTLDMTTAKK